MSPSPSQSNVLVGLLRVTIPGIALLAAVGVVSVTLIRIVQYYSVLRSFPAQMKSEVGEAAVKAIYAYRNEYGLWPLELGDIVPLQLRHYPPHPWEYIWNGYDSNPVLRRAGGPLDTAVQYQFPIADEQSPSTGWSATSAGDSIWIDPSQELPPATEASPEEVEQRRRGILKRRTEDHRGDERHAAEYARVMGRKP